MGPGCWRSTHVQIGIVVFFTATDTVSDGGTSVKAEPSHEQWRPVVLPPAPPASSEAVRRVLQRNGRRDTAPELALRRELHALGLRFLVDATPAGTSRRRRADVVLRSSRIAVRVHGCFWHRCSEHFHAPKANAEWWRAKFDSIVDRDADTERQLREAGWLPVVVWEHEDMAEAARRIAVLHAARRRERRGSVVDVAGSGAGRRPTVRSPAAPGVPDVAAVGKPVLPDDGLPLEER